MSESAPRPLRKALITTVKAAILIAAISVLAADWLARSGIDRAGMGQLATRYGRPEPLTTGTITRAGEAKVEPCAVRPERKR